MKYSKKLKTYVTGHVEVLKQNFYLQEYDVRLGFEDDEDTEVAASMKTDSKYLRCTLLIFPHVQEKFDKGHYRDVYEILLHEFCHTLTEPLYDVAIDGVTNSARDFLEGIRERQTQRIKNVIMRTVTPAVYMPHSKSKHKRNG